jgi:ketosteroid isomerase-like protein
VSQENVEIVCGSYEALNRRDFDAWLDFFHADVEVHDLPTVPDAPVIRGRDELRSWIEAQSEVWTDDSYYELGDFTTSGDFLIVAVRAHAWGRGSGAPAHFSFFQVIEMRDGKVQRAWAYFDKADALEAAGLTE